MRIRSAFAAMLAFGGSLAFAQVCPSTPGSVCLVPSQSTTRLQANTYIAPSTAMTTMTTVPYTPGTYMPGIAAMPGCPMMTSMGTTGYYTTPMTVSPGMCPMTTSMGTGQICSGVSADANCISGQIASLRNDVRSLQGSVVAASLQVRGQQLLAQVNSLMSDEMLFRHQIAANPNLPGAQAMANSLMARSNALNRDLSAFNRELALIPADQRPYLASSLNAFTVAYWDPTMQQFSAYTTQFAQSTPTYQPAFAANPWLQSWQSGYQTSLNNLGTVPQMYASNSWWSSTQVLGSTECYNAGMTSMVPMTMQTGTWVYIPAGSVMGTTGMTCPPMASTVIPPATTTTTVLGTTETYPPVTTTPPAATTTTTTTTTTPPATTTTPAPGTGMTGQGY